MKTLFEKLKHDYMMAKKQDKAAKKAKIDRFWSFIHSLGLRLESDYDIVQAKKDYMAEQISRDTGYARARAEIKDGGEVVVTDMATDLEEIDGIEIIDCRSDGQSHGEELKDFLDGLTNVSTTMDLIDLEAKYPSYMNYSEVTEFVNWCWDEIESGSKQS